MHKDYLPDLELYIRILCLLKRRLKGRRERFLCSQKEMQKVNEWARVVVTAFDSAFLRFGNKKIMLVFIKSSNRSLT
jgi:hypothetical protein